MYSILYIHEEKSEEILYLKYFTSKNPHTVFIEMKWRFTGTVNASCSYYNYGDNAGT